MKTPMRYAYALLAAVALLFSSLVVVNIAAPPKAEAATEGYTLTLANEGSNQLTTTEFWTGEYFAVLVNLTLSGDAAALPDSTVTIKIPHNEYIDEEPQWSGPPKGSYETEDTGDYWVYTAKVNDLQNGGRIQLPVQLRFKPYTTPNGIPAPITVSWDRADGTNLQKASATFRSKATSDYLPKKYIEIGNTQGVVKDGEDEAPVRHYSVTKADFEARKLPVDNPKTWYYGICAHPKNDAPRGGIGEYKAKSIRIVDFLPEGAVMVPASKDSRNQGWVETTIDGRKAVVMEAPLTDPKVNKTWAGSTPYCAGLNLAFPGVAVGTDDAPKIYTNRAQITMDYDQPDPKKLPEVYVKNAFRISEAPKPGGKVMTTDPVVNKSGHQVFTFWDNQFLESSGKQQTFTESTSGIGEALTWDIGFGSKNNGGFYRGEVDAVDEAGNAVYEADGVTRAKMVGEVPTPKGGRKMKIREIRDHQFTEGAYFREFIIDSIINLQQNCTEETEPKNVPCLTEDVHRQRFVDSKPRLYGVTEDGTEEVLNGGKVITIGEPIAINDSRGKYRELRIKFEDPLITEAVEYKGRVSAGLTAAEWQMWRDKAAEQLAGAAAFEKTYFNRLGTSFIKESIGIATEPESGTMYFPRVRSWNDDAESEKRDDWVPGDEQTKFLRTLTPSLKAEKPRDMLATYADCDATVGPDKSEWTPKNCSRVLELFTGGVEDREWRGLLDQPRNVRAVTLLPPGVEFLRAGTATKEDNVPVDIEPKVIPNYRDTGRTAVIYDFGDIKTPAELNNKLNRVRASYLVDVTMNAPRDGVAENYLLWDNNDQIAASTAGAIRAADEYDFDGDGDTEEFFSKETFKINNNPPGKVNSYKAVSIDLKTWSMQSPAQDLGGDVYYRLTIDNQMLSPVENADGRHFAVIDKLPAIGDHVMVANQEGVYEPRTWELVDGEEKEAKEGSAIVTPLVGPIDEFEPNAAILDLFDFYYTFTKEGETPAGLPASDLQGNLVGGKWLTKEEVGDRWDEVTAFKAVLKEGKVLPPSRPTVIYTHNRMPLNADTVELPIGSKAVNSMGISFSDKVNHDGDAASIKKAAYLESTSVQSEMVYYSMEGITWQDLNNDGEFQDSEPLIPGMTAELIDTATGEVVVDPLTNQPAVATTDANGHYFLRVFKRGEYRVRFTKAKTVADKPWAANQAGEDPVKNDLALQADDAAAIAAATGETASFNLNPRHRHDYRNAAVISSKRPFELHKSDETGKPLQGTEFTLTYKGAAPGEAAPVPVPSAPLKAVTDEKGVARWEDLPFGVYTLKEIKASRGFAIDFPDREITLSGSVSPYLDEEGAALVDEETDKALQYLPVTNQSINGSVSAKKLSDFGAKVGLAGAQFALFAKDEEGNLIGWSDTAAERKPAYGPETSDKDGLVNFPKVGYGDYRLVEVVAPVGHLLPEDPVAAGRDVVIRDQGESVKVGDVVNTRIMGDVVVAKVDARTNTAGVNAPIAGVEFGLFALSDVANPTSGTPVRKPDEVDTEEKPYRTALTDVDGIARFAKVPSGTYLLKETKAAAGFRLSEVSRLVQVTTNGAVVAFDKAGTWFVNDAQRGTLKVTKVSQSGKDEAGKPLPLAGAVFELLRSNGEPVDVSDVDSVRVTTAADGTAEFTGVRLGSYLVREVKAPYGYVISDAAARGIAAKVDKDLQEVTVPAVTNRPIRGSVVLQKLGALHLENGTVDGVSPETTTTVSVTPTSITDDAPGTTAEDPTDVATEESTEATDAEETSTTTTTTTDPEVVKAADDALASASAEASTEVTPEGVCEDLGACLGAGELGPLAGVEFRLTRQDSMPGMVKEYTATSNDEGVVEFTDVEFGHYLLEEISTLDGYNQLVRAYQITVAADGARVDLGKVWNKISTATVKVTKTDRETGKPLKGVGFALLQGTVPAYTALTDALGVATFTDVIVDQENAGHYQLVETNPLEGYNPAGIDQEIVVTEDGQLIEMAVTNIKIYGQVEALKVDNLTGEKLAGATFGLFPVTKANAADNAEEDDTTAADDTAAGTVADTPAYEATSDEEGRVFFPRVVYGDYLLKEIAPAEHYLLTEETREVKIREEAVTVNAGAVGNQIFTGTVTGTKSAADTGRPLAGVKFALFAPEDTEFANPLYNAETDETGSYSFEGVRFGEYTLVELASAPGYRVENNTWPVDARWAEDAATLVMEEIVNTRIRGAVALTKVAAEDPNHKLAGAVFEIYPVAKADGIIDPDIPALATGTTDENGYLIFEDLLYGEYELREVTAPEWYVPLPNALPVVIRDHGVTVDLGEVANTHESLSATMKRKWWIPVGIVGGLAAVAGGVAAYLGSSEAEQPVPVEPQPRSEVKDVKGETAGKPRQQLAVTGANTLALTLFGLVLTMLGAAVLIRRSRKS